ncbi:pirin family protein [Alkanindiges sp. WGS2144]|uniref:pirin family protein n=1 Tax=Alkanindiges sp. WGS2144 TaxID=3366808 RepID=UPI003752AA9E
MSVDKLIAKEKDVGGIPVARMLPNKGKRTIGAWCFLDHAGPAIFQGDSKGLQVGLHPHTNLQTFTWMLEGEVLHKDSLGNEQTIQPGQVNLMTAGTGADQGISHTEQTVEGCDRLHAVQLWIALPMDRAIEPSFYNYPDLPVWSDNDVTYTITTGAYAGRQADTLQYSRLLGLDIQVNTAQTLQLEQQAGFEYGILVIQGRVQFKDEDYHSNELISLTHCGRDNTTDTITLFAEADTHFMLLGGEPLPHPTVMWWNFVDKDIAGLQQSVKDWNEGRSRFGDIDLDGTSLKRLVAPVL